MIITFEIEPDAARELLARCWPSLDVYAPQLRAALEDAMEAEIPEAAAIADTEEVR